MKRLTLLIPVFPLLLLYACSEEPKVAGVATEQETRPVSTVDSALITRDSSVVAMPAQPVIRQSQPAAPKPTEQPFGFDIALERLLPPPQVFALRADRDTVLQGAGGTLLRIPANSFTDAAGRPVSGPVRVELEEFYSAAAILAAGLHSQSGERLLETGGMIYWSASSAGAELRLAPGAGVTVAFPVQAARDGMQLFTGLDRGGRFDWEVLPNGEARLQRGFQPARYPGGTGALSAHFEQFINPEDGLLPGERRRYTMRLRISPEGRSELLRITPEPPEALRRSVTRALAQAAAWQPATRLGIAVSDTCTHYLNFQWDIMIPKGDTMVAATQSELAALRRQEPKDPEPQQVLQNTVYYLMGNALMGWLNCDRFVDDPGPRADFVLKFDPKREDVRVICNRLRSFLAPEYGANGTARVKGLPAGEPVTVMAIRKNKGELLVAFAEMKAGDPVPALSYASMSLGEIRRRMDNLASGR